MGSTGTASFNKYPKGLQRGDMILQTAGQVLRSIDFSAVHSTKKAITPNYRMDNTLAAGYRFFSADIVCFMNAFLIQTGQCTSYLHTGI